MYDTYWQVWNELTAEGQQFQVDEAEVRGSPMRVYTNAPPSLREVWLASAAFAERDYLVCNDERQTYADAHREVASIANWLISRGVNPGERVAIAARNYPEWLLAYWACVATGITVVGVNAWWVEDELEYGLSDSQPKVIFCDEERLARFQNIRDRFPEMTVVGIRQPAPADGVIDYAEVKAAGGDLPDVPVDPDSDACIFYTSGTTGFPKGAQLTQRGCVHNIMNLAFAGRLATLATARIQGVEPPDPESAPIGASLLTTPLFHVTANNCVAHGSTLTGGKLVFMYRWDPLEALRIIEAEKITAMTGVPVMAREIISHPDFDQYDTSSLLSLGGGGAQVQPDLVQKIDDAVAARPGTGYGMTETCGIITSISGDYFIDKPASCGPAMPVFETRVIDGNGNALPRGQAGELWVRGAPVIKGYINRPEATAETITDGWLHTGDVANIDEDGFIFIVDRVKDMVLRGGENVYCSEVETTLHRIDAIAECSVFGIPDDRLGEEIGVSIYLKEDTSLTAGELRAFCQTHMARHKVPRYIWFSNDPLPRNANGKFLKRELRDTLDLADAV